MKSFAILAACVAIALAAEIPPYPKNGPAYPAPAYEPLMPYSFGYAVKDQPTYNDFAHQEVADTKAVTGSYKVALPDGRIQIVSYKADENGYVADVKYQGEAKPYNPPVPAPYPPKP